MRVQQWGIGYPKMILNRIHHYANSKERQIFGMSFLSFILERACEVVVSRTQGNVSKGGSSAEKEDERAERRKKEEICTYCATAPALCPLFPCSYQETHSGVCLVYSGEVFSQNEEA